MELTIDNLISIITEKLGFKDIEITKDTYLRTYIDGDDVIYLLEKLIDKFHVIFENFEFKKYYHDEGEVMEVINWFGLKKMRKIEHELTIGELYDYMKKNRKVI